MRGHNPGDVFAGYTIERELGAGGMGEVYLVRHPRLPRHEALKILAAQLCDDPQFRSRFEREADVVAALRHPFIVGVHDRGETDGRLWIAYDYIDGHDLNHHVTGDLLPLAAIARIVEQVADALDEAARHGLIHRDVKPANILLDSRGRAFLTDFGIAHASHPGTRITSTGTTLGTVAYAAPEQLQGLRVDARTDQYALSCTAFTLLTGTVVYPGNNSIGAAVLAHVQDPVPAASARRPGRVPPAADHVLARAMAKDPAHRYPDSRTFAAALTHAVCVSTTSVAISVPAPTATPSQALPVATNRLPAPGGNTHQFAPTMTGPAPGEAPVRRRRGRHLTTVIGALIVVSGLVAGTFAVRSSGSGSATDPAAGMTRVPVSQNLADLRIRRESPSWVLRTDSGQSRRGRRGIVGADDKYAFAVGEEGSLAQAPTKLIVVDAATGRTDRTITLTDDISTVERCDTLGQHDLVCWIRPQHSLRGFLPALVNLRSDTVKFPVSEDEYSVYAVTGDRFLHSSAKALRLGSSLGVDNLLTATAHGDFVVDPVDGSPVVHVVDPPEGLNPRLVSLNDGRTVYEKPLRAGFRWQPFATGFAVSEWNDKLGGEEVAFHDASGHRTAAVTGDWNLIPYGLRRLQNRTTVTSLPILANKDAKVIAAFDPSTGKRLWQHDYELQDLDEVYGFGTKVVAADRSESTDVPATFEWLDCYTGEGGLIDITGLGAFNKVTPLGTDGTRFAVLAEHNSSQPATQELLVYEPGETGPSWRMTIPVPLYAPGDPVVSAGKVFAGGEMTLGDRRIL